MKISSKDLKKIENFALESYADRDFFHNFDHAFMTAKIAIYIAKKEGADILVCKIAGLLHDVSPKTRGKPHGIQSAKIACAFLDKIQIDKKIINQVYLAIAFHDTSRHKKAKTQEGKIIFEADKLQCFGAIGFVREYGDLLVKGTKPRVALEDSIQYLKTYAPSFITSTGKKLRTELLQVNRLFIKDFERWDRLKGLQWN